MYIYIYIYILSSVDCYNEMIKYFSTSYVEILDVKQKYMITNNAKISYVDDFWYMVTYILLIGIVCKWNRVGQLLWNRFSCIRGALHFHGIIYILTHELLMFDIYWKILIIRFPIPYDHIVDMTIFYASYINDQNVLLDHLIRHYYLK